MDGLYRVTLKQAQMLYAIDLYTQRWPRGVRIKTLAEIFNRDRNSITSMLDRLKSERLISWDVGGSGFIVLTNRGVAAVDLWVL